MRAPAFSRNASQQQCSTALPRPTLCLTRSAACAPLGVSIFACLTLTVGWMMMWKDPKLTNDNDDFTTIFDVTDPFDEKHWDRAYNGISSAPICTDAPPLAVPLPPLSRPRHTRTLPLG